MNKAKVKGILLILLGIAMLFGFFAAVSKTLFFVVLAITLTLSILFGGAALIYIGLKALGVDLP